MNLRHTVLALALAGCAYKPAPAPAAAPDSVVIPASAQQDRAGDSTATAITVPGDAPEEGVPFENEWIYERYGKFRRTGGGTGTLQGRRYDVVEVELPTGGTHKVYFDITENWTRWTPAPK